MIDAVQYRNFKALRDAVLPLSRLTVLIGPNGSGKSTAIEGIRLAAVHIQTTVGIDLPGIVTANVESTDASPFSIRFRWSAPFDGLETRWEAPRTGATSVSITAQHVALPEGPPEPIGRLRLLESIQRFRIYSLNASAIAQPVRLREGIELGTDGAGLAGVLDQLRDQEPERFEQFNRDLVRWFPEFDRVLFKTPVEGHRLILLRSRAGYAVPASALSHGTLLALALMTLGFLRETPPFFAIEEPERGVHPRLLSVIRDALFRLAYPEEYGDDRPGRQIIVTSHSPYFLDLFRENPENVVLAHKESGDVRFERLSDRPDMEEILRDVHLGEAWYSGVLGGA